MTPPHVAPGLVDWLPVSQPSLLCLYRVCSFPFHAMPTRNLTNIRLRDAFLSQFPEKKGQRERVVYVCGKKSAKLSCRYISNYFHVVRPRKQASKQKNRPTDYDFTNAFLSSLPTAHAACKPPTVSRARALVHYTSLMALQHGMIGRGRTTTNVSAPGARENDFRSGWAQGLARKRMERSVVFTTPAVRRLYENRRTKYFADVIEKSCNRRALAGRAGSDRAAPPGGSSVTGWSTGR